MDEECNTDVLRLENDPPEELAQCICQTDTDASLCYLFLRDIFSIYHFTVLMIGIILVVLDNKLKFYIFFDFWTQALLFIASEFGSYGVVRLLSESLDGYNNCCWVSVPWYSKIYWALFSAALPSTFLSAVIFWTQLFNKKVHVLHTVVNIATPFMTFLEFMIIAFPIRLLHFMYFVIFYAIYIAFTVGYQKCGGTGVKDSVPIYKDLDWRHWTKALLTASIGLAIGLAVYFIFCFISMAKFRIRYRNEYY